MTPECPFEQAVISTLVKGRWPDGCDESLRDHVGQCPACAGLVDLMMLLRADRDHLEDHAGIPAAGQVWWRAAVRARVEATQSVSRPLSWLLGIAGASLLGLAVAAAAAFWTPAWNAMLWGAQHAQTIAVEYGQSFNLPPDLARVGVLFVIGSFALLVVAPLALYLTLSDD